MIVNGAGRCGDVRVPIWSHSSRGVVVPAGLGGGRREPGLARVDAMAPQHACGLLHEVSFQLLCFPIYFKKNGNA